MSDFSVAEMSGRLDGLRRCDIERHLFGAREHQYRLGPCLSLEQVGRCEAEYSIALPKDYIEFLTTIGNGGAGPGYGLERFVCLSSKHEAPKPPRIEKRRVPGREIFPPTPCDDDGNELDRWDFRYFDSAASYAPDGELGRQRLSKPFPLSAPFRSITDRMWDVRIPNWDKPIEAEHRKNRQHFAEISASDGALRIAHYGSAIHAMVVLNGPFRGQVWIHEPNLGDYVPASMRSDLHDSTIKVEHAYHHHHKAPSFSDWYSHWLDTAASEVERAKAEAARLREKRDLKEPRPATGKLGKLIASGEVEGMQYDLYAAPPPESAHDDVNNDD